MLDWRSQGQNKERAVLREPGRARCPELNTGTRTSEEGGGEKKSDGPLGREGKPCLVVL